SGQILVTGGIGQNYRYLASAELYDPQTQSFTSTASMVTARAAHTATLLSDGRVLIAGGVVCDAGNCTQLSSAEVYDPIQQKFRPVASMAAARASHTATLLSDGTVLIAGGVQGGVGLSSAEIYSPVVARFIDTGAMKAPRFLHSATLLNDREVLVAGGRACTDECDDNSASVSAEVYDPDRHQFFPAGKLNEGRILHTATRLNDGRVLISGGRSC